MSVEKLQDAEKKLEPKYEFEEVKKPNYQSEYGWTKKGFAFDTNNPETSYFNIDQVKGSRYIGKGMLEFKKGPDGKYASRYLTFKNHGEHDYRSVDTTALPDQVKVFEQKKLEALNPKSQSEDDPELQGDALQETRNELDALKQEIIPDAIA